MTVKFSRSTTPHPTPPVCKVSEPNPTPDADPCLPTIVLIVVTLTGFDDDGFLIWETKPTPGTKTPGVDAWTSETTFASTTVAARIERGGEPPEWFPSAIVTSRQGNIHLMASGITVGWPCPPFSTPQLTRLLIPGPGSLTLQMFG